MITARSIRGLWALGLCLVAGCGGAGRYGYARQYVYADGEERFAQRADADAVYDEVRRFPHQYADREFGWFGVVREVTPAPNGEAQVLLELRTHQARHLCEDESAASCRVTVSAESPGSFVALVRLREDDREGEHRVQPLSLLRVYGPLAQSASSGASAEGPESAEAPPPVIRAGYYRHWPRGQYVTTAAAGTLRR